MSNDLTQNLTALNETALQHAKTLLQQSKNICILTGAGISAESGIPTFRDKQTGLWENYRAEDLASIDAFERNPNMVWSWYQWRRNLVKDKKPNPAHFALAKLQQWGDTNGKTVTLITQNVDDLHEQAGSTATHLHGHLWKNKCSDCGSAFDQEVDYTNDALLNCPICDAYVRPDIVWFGEMLPQQEWQVAEAATAQCDVFVSIGTSSLVYPAAGLSQLAKNNGASLIEVNLNPTENPILDVILAGKAGIILPKLIESTIDTPLST